MQTALGHKAQQTDRLESYRLAARVRSGYQESRPVASELYVCRHYLIRRYERMAPRFYINYVVSVELRLGTVHHHRELSLGVDEIELGHQPLVVQQALEMFTDSAAE